MAGEIDRIAPAARSGTSVRSPTCRATTSSERRNAPEKPKLSRARSRSPIRPGRQGLAGRRPIFPQLAPELSSLGAQVGDAVVALPDFDPPPDGGPRQLPVRPACPFSPALAGPGAAFFAPVWPVYRLARRDAGL